MTRTVRSILGALADRNARFVKLHHLRVFKVVFEPEQPCGTGLANRGPDVGQPGHDHSLDLIVVLGEGGLGRCRFEPLEETLEGTVTGDRLCLGGQLRHEEQTQGEWGQCEAGGRLARVRVARERV